MLHSHYLCGKQSMGLKITLSMMVMMAAANSNQPDIAVASGSARLDFTTVLKMGDIY